MKEILANKHTVHIHVSELTEEETARMVIVPLGELEPFDSSSVRLRPLLRFCAGLLPPWR